MRLSRRAEYARDAAEHRLRAVVHHWSPGLREAAGDRGTDLPFDPDDAASGRRVSVGPWSRPALRGLVLLLAVIGIVVGYLAWQAQPRDVVVAPTVGASPGALSGGSADIAPQILATGAPMTGATDPQVGPPVSEGDPAGLGGDEGSVTEIVVHVTGLVRRPGLVRLPAGARVADAIDEAGGITRRRAEGSVNLARVLTDGEQIVVTDVAPQPSAGPTPPPTGAGGTVGASPLDLNTATLEQLDGLPGVGPVLAGRILQWRSAHGRFRSVDELGEVSGIGEAILGQLRPLVRV